LWDPFDFVRSEVEASREMLNYLGSISSVHR
jgi:hypothetical protein